MEKKFKLPERYGKGEKSVWVEYIQLCLDEKPKVNLGQGFSDYGVPSHITNALSEVATGPDVLLNQYTRGYGHPKLVQQLARLYGPLVNREINPLTEVLVGAGAYEALFASILGHVDKGDEVIIIEPFFDCYEPMVRMSGGVPVFVPLKPNKTSGEISSADWVLDKCEFEKAFSARTKLLILNTPHNPIGKVFDMKELCMIAELCKKYNVLVIADEVYEWMVYPPKQHIRIATLPDMWERTITIGSAGKTFSVTGWKIGWAYGPADIMKNVFVVHQNCVYTCSTPLQEAIARAFEIEIPRLGKPECYFQSIVQELLPKRAAIIEHLKEACLNPTIPEAGYFIVADWSELATKLDLSKEQDQYKDYKFTKHMIKNASVVAIPPSAFYSKENKHLGENYARFCFIKKDENIALAGKLIKEWVAKLK